MSERKSVLEPKPKVIHADDRTMSPCVNWLSWRTWAVFLGFNLALAATATIVLLFCAYVIEHWIRDMIAQYLGDLMSLYLTIGPMALAVGWIWYAGLRRAFPVRDKAGKRVPGNPRLESPSSSILIFFPWMAGFLWISLEAVILAGDVVTVFAERSPIWVVVVVVGVSGLVLEIPYRVLWRAPVRDADP